MIGPILPAAIAVRRPATSSTIRSAERPRRRSSSASAIVGDMVKAGKVKVVAARYDLESSGQFVLSPKA